MFTFPVGFANDLDAWVPEYWSQISLAILEEEMSIGSVVNRDFSPQVQSQGDTVNTRRPNQYVAKRKSAADEVTVQDSEATNVAIKLDQHPHVSFAIKDAEQSLAMDDMIKVYLRPAAVALARKIDKILLAQTYRFMSRRSPTGNNCVGNLLTQSSSNIKALVIAADRAMNENRAPEDGRILWVTNATKAIMLELDHLTKVNEAGGNDALRRAQVGNLFNFDVMATYNQPYMSAVSLDSVQADDLAADATAGDSTITVDSGATYIVGEYIYFPGVDACPYKITGIATDTVTLNRPLRYDLTAATQDVQAVATGLVDLTGHSGVTAYGIGYDQEIQVDGGAVPKVGQLVSFSTAGTPNVNLAPEYGIVDVTLVSGTTYQIELDRALETAIVDGDIVGYGPAGNFNLAMHPDAFTMVIRPLEPAKPGLAISGAASYNDLAMRTTITYDGRRQEHLVTLDLLMGVMPLDANFAVPVLG
jgi:hypothetical protein